VSNQPDDSPPGVTPEHSPRFDVFISYSAADKEIADRIAAECKSRGLTTWFDDWKLKPGGNWRDQIREAIQNSRICIVLISNSTNPHGPWISLEWSAIQRNVWQRPDCLVLPVKTDRNVQTPAFLKQWHAVILTKDLKSKASQVADFIVEGSSGPAKPPREDADRIDRFKQLSTALERIVKEQGGNR
jgi:hypothetical protein